MTCFLVNVKHIEIRSVFLLALCGAFHRSSTIQTRICSGSVTGNGLFTLFEALSGAEVWKKASGYCHGCMWRWLGGSVLSCEKTVCYSLRLDGKEEVEIVSQNFGCIHFVCLFLLIFVFSTGK